MRKNQQKNILFFTLGFLLVVALGVSGSWYLFSRPQPALPTPPDVSGPAPLPPPVVGESLHPLTGLPVSPKYGEGGLLTENASTTRPFAVMIDNTPEARPQYGLHRADIVYHLLTEGGVTRYLALFSSQPAERIGPVRSARPYFIRHAQDWDAIYVHSGGSATALQILQENPSRISDLNEFSNGPYFWRTRITQPHNLFTSSELLLAATVKREIPLTLDAVPTWGFTNDLYPGAPSTTSLSIPYQMESMNVSYQYNADTDSFDRTQGKSAQYDKIDGKRISPANVLLVFKHYADISDPLKLGLIDFADNGAGEIILLTKGQQIRGRWSRAKDGPTVYSTNTGRTLFLSPGQTFIEVLPSEFKGKITLE